MRTLLRGGIVDGRGVGDLVIEDEHIAAVGPGLTAPHVIDVSGHLVLPGLINCHTHISLTHLRGVSDDLPLFPWLKDLVPHIAGLTPSEMQAATRRGLTEMLQSGTTTVCDVGPGDPEWVPAIAAELGLRTLSGPSLRTEYLGTPVPFDLEAAADRIAALRRQYGPRHRFFLGVHAPYNCEPEKLAAVHHRAWAMGLPFMTHLAESEEEERILLQRHGRRPVDLLADLEALEGSFFIHCVQVTAADMDRLAAAGARVAHCPASNAKLASGVAPVPEMRAAGIAVGLGTDSAGSNNTLSMLSEMRMAVLLQRAARRQAPVLTARDALDLATIEAARCLGWADEIGSLEPGKRADITVIQVPEPFRRTPEQALAFAVYAAEAADVAMVFVDGRRLK